MSAAAIGAAVVLAACGSSTPSSVKAAARPSPASTPKSGGTLTVFEGVTFGAWVNGFDPATSTTALANEPEMEAIYGQLFDVNSKGQVLYDLATGYKFSNAATTLTIDLRHGVTFSNGAPFNSTAVKWNFTRDLDGDSTGKPAWSVKSITTPGPYTVVINFKTPDGAAINQFQNAIVNWIASPSAYTKLGEKTFEFTPVGAGPFVVTGDVVDSKLTLKRNTRYWEKGHPYLNGLVFEDTDSDETALEGMEAHAAQAYEYMTTPSLRKNYKGAGFTVTTEPSVQPTLVKLNTFTSPFSSLKAREALYYATDPQVLDNAIYDGTCQVTESFTAPAGLFYTATVPDYRKYDLNEAKKLVSEVPGGVSFSLLAETGEGYLLAEALRDEWEAAGMTVTIKTVTLDELIEDEVSRNWDAAMSTGGAWDPSAGIGPAFLYEGAFSGVDNATLDSLLSKAEGTRSTAARKSLYLQVGTLVSSDAYSPYLFACDDWNITAKGVNGPGLTTTTPILASVLWQDVYMK